MKKIFLLCIGSYQSLRGMWPGTQCRFQPSCSCFAQEAIVKYPLYRSLPKIAGRLLRCHPFSRGGWDPA